MRLRWNEATQNKKMKRTWYVLHVKPRTEKKVAQYLQVYGYFCHLPLYDKVYKLQRRTVKRQLPMFPGYVFTRLLPDERVTMLKTNLIVRTIEAPSPRQMIHQLRQVAHIARTGHPLTPKAEIFNIGEFVKVKYGPFRGTEGYIKREGAKATFVLNVDILGSSVEVSISPEDLEKTNSL